MTLVLLRGYKLTIAMNSMANARACFSGKCIRIEGDRRFRNIESIGKSGVYQKPEPEQNTVVYIPLICQDRLRP
jgi:hypothetical protein